jgi:hypothetical protein
MKLSKGLKLALKVARRQWQKGGGKTTKDRKKDKASSDDEASSIRFKSRKRRMIPTGVCQACESPHVLLPFPDQTFKEWKPTNRVQNIVDKNLKDDPTLKEEARRLLKGSTR